MQQSSSSGNSSRQVVLANHFKGPFSHQQTEDSDATPISANCSSLQVPLQPEMTETSYMVLNVSGNTNFVHFKILSGYTALSLVDKSTKLSNGRRTLYFQEVYTNIFLYLNCHSYLNGCFVGFHAAFP